MALTNKGAALVAGLIAFAGAAPALAASPATQAFLANLVPNVDFLDRSSRFALKNSKNAKLRDFAFATAREQTLAADALYDWTLADAKPSVGPAAAAALDKTPTGSTTTGSTARPEPAGWVLPALAAGKAPDGPLPLGQEDLDSLEGLEGPAFDAQYKEKQADALRQVEADYAAYLDKGDDAALRKIAARELPKIRKRRTALAKT